jgi:radical SAM superfamily enzyme YgiQ (UPF0313 family)
MKYKALLINPWIYDFAATNMWARPLGLLKVAEFLSAYNIDIHCIDCMDSFRTRRNSMGKYPKEFLPTPGVLKGVKRRYGRYGISVSDFTHRLKQILPVDIILLTGIMTYWYAGVQEAIRICREFAPGVPIILGGIYATLFERHASETSGADIVYKGAVDEKLIRILAYTGMGLKKVRNQLKYYHLRLYQREAYAPLMTSEGCPYRCSYCASSLLSGRFDQRKADDVLKEIGDRYRTGVRDFAFYDDALLLNSDEHIEVILKGVIKSGQHARFHAPNGLHARFVDSDIASLMKEAGFKTLRLSLETINPERQRQYGAKVFNEELRSALSFLKRAGFTKKELGVYLMYGFPGQEFDEVREGVKYLKSLDARIHLAEFSPIPGTELWRDLIARGTITEDIDPLLTNNTVFSSIFTDYTDAQIRELKDTVLKYNHAHSS